jgi:hypothetical protein
MVVRRSVAFESLGSEVGGGDLMLLGYGSVRVLFP